ncbi:MAG: lipid kinase [Pseudomonadales bacterium]|uniref:ABC transporter permease n=1 Tax=unclassified Ketobacter TaxID=2639109 RepID=UPI000C912C9B|nr:MULTISPECIES: ABC transporter permease [unclassified Ketobacter]MAQ26170.1 lipid kinase [Pseudomonadales bacterium]MEC8811559.1 ABC transporter permease [Pseudomonadota bacterium]TNC90255.1 MAG: lipid kinase [Alcanivorax sp.]HAG95645.1 lipid kinase [Gammaproteobacteria bacterium]MCK5791212.1 ABC transporter permease [Ketobacter sp.]|tara:strand:+ start:1727 stop:2554 length:828 start_codon:yes stop_codon:yes gene_type:complete
MKKLINQHPTKPFRWLLGVIPFLILLLFYVGASNARLAENPNDKLLPAFSSFTDAMQRMAFEPSKRSGEYVFWQDTASSLERLGIGVGISALIALTIGVMNGVIPFVRANLSPLVTAISLVPPMAILPVLFIVFGLGELSKIVLIAIGITPFLIRDMQQRALEIPAEQIIKAQTLGANTWQIIVRVVLPQVMPRLIASVRLSLGSAWLFLIAAEAIAATDGLGYRIFLVRRYLSMDVILPYVLWITLLAFAIDYLLRVLSKRLYPWFHSQTPEGA